MKAQTISIQMGILICAIAAFGQGSFQNLDFESAQVIPDPYYGVPYIIATSNALPGWQAFSGTNQLSDVFYNVAFNVELVGGTNSLVIGGNISVGLYNGGSISQSALVPADAESLLVRAHYVTPLAPGIFSISLGGQNLQYTAIPEYGEGPFRYLFAADVSAFADQTETLTFLTTSGGFVVDDIQFSPELIPEPSLSCLLFLGSGALFCIRRRRQPTC